MSRGRKPNSSAFNGSPSNLFYESVGSYFQTIISNLGQSNNPISNESSSLLLNEIRSISKVCLPEIGVNVMPYKIPQNWVWCRLGEVVEWTDNLNIQSKLSSNTIINYVDIDAIDNKKYVIREVKQRTVSELSSRARRVLKKGYLLYSLVRPYLNNIAIIEEEKQNFIGSTGFAVFSGIKIENDFIKYYLLSDFVRKRYLDMLSGFNSPSITYEQFASTPFPLAPLQEQNKIISFLKDFELSKLKDNYYFNNNVENNIRKLNIGQKKGIELKDEFISQSNHVKQLRQSFLREAMQGQLVKQNPKDGHAKGLLEKIKAEKAKSGRKEKELPPIKTEEIPFEIPENWAWCRLGEIAANVEYGTSEKAEMSSNHIPVLRMNNIQDGKLDYEKLKYVKSTIEDLPKLYLKKGDLLFNRTNSYELVGKSGVYHGKNDMMTFASYLIRVQFSNNISVNFINSYINSILCRTTQLEPDIIQQNGQANFNGTKLKHIICPLPPLPEQHRIVKKLEQLMLVCDELQKSIEQSREQNEMLLRQVLKEALNPN